ncbi:tyrosinase family oxidase copper chaperone [Streptomyces beijiangensis]|uniref:tyrosinase family oxidase copper chaperone n=1 Tax=Streptomyces beijiangensis TaxID=163361 RepID=UPI0027DC3255|nr:tyrosinase family oxidase copper chaperone [Streptomyces beijiangensis]
MLQSLSAVSVSAFTGAALVRIVNTPRTAPPRSEAADLPARTVVFDEMYRGRRVAGYTEQGQDQGASSTAVYIDGRRLHLMRCADGGYLSPIDHYQSYPTELATARAAVAELGSAQLALTPVHGGGTHEGGHDVRP